MPVSRSIKLKLFRDSMMSYSSCCAALRQLFALAVAASSWLLSLQANAVTTNWNTNSGGNFTNAAHWDNGVPDADDTAVFNRGFVAYTVTVPGAVFGPPPDYVINYLRVNTNEVSLVDSPVTNRPSLTVANRDVSIVIGENGGDVAIVNSTLRRVSGANTSIGRSFGAEGTLNVSSGTFSMSGSITVGDSGDGYLTIQNGGNVSSDIGVLGANIGSHGQVTVTGAGSTWINNSYLLVGDVTTGGLMITDGGSVSDYEGYIAFNCASPNATSTVIVAGPGSTWTNQRTLNIGEKGVGVLRIESGGAVSSAVASVGTNKLSGEDSVVVRDAGSTWTNSGDLTLGNNDIDFFDPERDTLHVSHGGEVSVGGFLFIERSGLVSGNSKLSATVVNRGGVSPGPQLDVVTGVSPGALQIDGSYLQSGSGFLAIGLGGTTPGTQYDQLQVNGPVTLNGTLVVLVANSFVPSAGNMFDILDWTSLAGAFSTIQLPALPADLAWNTSQLYVSGVLSVGLAGDYNQNGVVDAADYVVWRKTLGQTGTGLVADGNANGQIDDGDYNVWRAEFGQTAGTGSGANATTAVPEPSAAVLVVMIAITVARGWPCRSVARRRAMSRGAL